MSGIEGTDLLLVEDNPQDAELARRAIGKEVPDARVYVARDGAVAMEFLEGTGPFAGRTPAMLPRVIFLDLKLPKVDGMEVLGRIKQDERRRRIPVVMLTSSHLDRDLIDAYRLGVNSYVVKPVEYERYTQVIGALARYWLTVNQTPRGD